jgi:glycosyltransferase involved in cell wall biosynthesis
MRTNGDIALRRLLHVFPSFSVGGAQARLAAIANHFGRSYAHIVVAMDGQLTCRDRLRPDLDVSFPPVPVMPGRTLANLRTFRRALRALRPDVLLTSNWGSIEWAMANALVRIPHVHLEDGFGPEERDRQMPRRVLARRILLRSATVVVPSLTLQRIATQTWRLPARRLRYIPNGVDLARFAPTGGQSNETPVIGLVAALRPEKNVGRLLLAAARIAPSVAFRIVIVGDGSERPALESQASTLGLSDRTTFAGALGDPSAAYRGFDIFALSSDTEQMPLSVLEAMASGLPVASTDVGDVRTMVAQENAAAIVPRDDAALADALAGLLADPARRRAIGAANRRAAESRFDEQAMFAAHGALFG